MRLRRLLPRTLTTGIHLHPSPPLLLPCWEGRPRVGTAGPCCGELWVAGYPCARYSAAEDGRAAAARRTRLKS
jgi:hypothetical protein